MGGSHRESVFVFTMFYTERTVRRGAFWAPMDMQSRGSNPQTLHGTAIYAYIDPQNHPN